MFFIETEIFASRYKYSPRSVNAGKAAANWEKKSKYLLAELVKYQTYVEALRVARQERQKRRDEKQVSMPVQGIRRMCCKTC